jgi:nitrate reductase gamma subunit
MIPKQLHKKRFAMNILSQLSSKVILTLILTLLLAMPSKMASADKGQELFESTCASCHSTGTNKIVGPGLQGIKLRRPEAWLIEWVKDSKKLIDSGDPDAVKVFNEYKKMAMPPNPSLSDEDILAIFAYVDASAPAEDAEEATSWFTWIVVILIICLFFAYRTINKARNTLAEIGVFKEDFSPRRYITSFWVMLMIAGLILYLLKGMLEDQEASYNTLFFGIFPYVAIAIFIVGSIYRYRSKGFKVSSLSTQFLEGKKLFWGSTPFHWGLMVLFLGHLTAFMFPSAIIAWNGSPVRLVILEITAFVFALSALLGLILLIKRRFRSPRVLVVSNKMDMMVYVILLVQILSGIAVAYHARWGSNWFASVMTPYLRSVFALEPDVNLVAQLSTSNLWALFYLKVHIISAFFIITIIPFSRFMHFLVAPIDYAWRKYQVVIWNYNHKKIRKSTRHFFGRKPKNH